MPWQSIEHFPSVLATPLDKAGSLLADFQRHTRTSGAMASFAVWSNFYYGCIGVAALAQAVMVTAAVAFIAGSTTSLFTSHEKAPVVGLI